MVTYEVYAASNSSSFIVNAHLNVFLELELNWLLLLLFVQPIKKKENMAFQVPVRNRIPKPHNVARLKDNTGIQRE